MHVYIAGPYTDGDTVLNVKLAVNAAERVVELGHVPLVPHLTLFWQYLHPHGYEYWMDYCFAWVPKCDALIRLPGNSKGADREMELAKEHNLKIFEGLHSFETWALGLEQKI